MLKFIYFQMNEFNFGENFGEFNFLKPESPTLNTLFTPRRAQQHLPPDTYLHLQLGIEQ